MNNEREIRQLQLCGQKGMISSVKVNGGLNYHFNLEQARNEIIRAKAQWENCGYNNLTIKEVR